MAVCQFSSFQRTFSFEEINFRPSRRFVAEISSFRNPGLFYAVLPFGLNPVAENDGSLAAICAKSASSSGVDIGAATSGGVDVGVVDDDESNQNLQAALSEFYRYVGLDSFCNLYTQL